MLKEKKRVRYEELTFKDDFIFCKVLENNPELCRELLELILGRRVGELVKVDQQKTIRVTPDHRGVRFDVYAEDDKSVVYDVEMQNLKKKMLTRRLRYSQSMIDQRNLEKGQDYSELADSYVIYICSFNMYEEIGLHKYVFRYLCLQDHDIELQDGSEIILLCTEGFQDDVSPGMKAFLRYVSGNVAEGDFTERLDKAVEVTKRDPRWRLEYMNLQEMIEERHREDQEYIEMLKQENGALEQENGALEQEIDVLRKQMAELREKLTAYQSGNTDASLHV